ncbi:hypothetical protein ACWEJ6_54615 [Nonomuraea sp. NPDC004702]
MTAAARLDGDLLIGADHVLVVAGLLRDTIGMSKLSEVRLDRATVSADRAARAAWSSPS